MGRLDGKVALVSGGARGIGAAIARRLLAEGSKVVAGDVLDEDRSQLAADLGDGVRYVHRTGQPTEIADLAVYLAADESSFVTGAGFVIDGGETAGTVAPPSA